jgi:methylamine dehydrogenase heavy chain
MVERLRFAFALLLLLSATGARAELPTEPLVNEPPLPAHPSAHWVWVNDVAFQYMADGRAYLIDGDAGRFLGMVNTGYGFNGVVLAHKINTIYSPEIYFSRGTRGIRTDVVTLYDPTTLSPSGEIRIPPKRAAIMPMVNDAVLTDDERFLLIYNFTPAQSVTVVDTRSRKFVGEININGCALVYPTGPRSFFSICSDGSLLNVTLNAAGKLAGSSHTSVFIDVLGDPVTEKGVRIGDTYWFVSFKGKVLTLKTSAAAITPGAAWWLTTAAERAQNWRPGGMQHLAVHVASRELYSVMHQGGEGSHKDPGKVIWVYDVDKGKRVRTIATTAPVGSIQVTQDAKPLLFAAFIGSNNLDIYDASSGTHLRTVPEVGLTPTTLVLP